MKKVIKGSLYDTETAQHLATHSNGYGYTDFLWCEESLYRTKAGKYFLHGEGGAKSRYARSAGNNAWTGGEEILPMNRSSAMEWAEEHLDGDEYEVIFGIVPEGPEMESLNILVPASMKEQIRTIAEEKHSTLTAVVEDILREGLGSKK